MTRRHRQLLLPAVAMLITACTETGGLAPGSPGTTTSTPTPVAPATSSLNSAHPTAQEKTMVITVTVGAASMPATLEDNAAAKDFAKQLPLTGQASDFNSSEKIVDLPGKLSTEGSPAGYDPEPGDLAYYAPWGNLAIFYRDAPYAAGLVKLGRISGDTEILAAQRGNFTIRIAAA